jgi:hypothetical protein
MFGLCSSTRDPCLFVPCGNPDGDEEKRIQMANRITVNDLWKVCVELLLFGSEYIISLHFAATSCSGPLNKVVAYLPHAPAQRVVGSQRAHLGLSIFAEVPPRHVGQR